MQRLSFLTGAPRSGTSLLTSLMGAFPGRIPLSQPIPLLLVALKRAFLIERGAPSSVLGYPLSDQQFSAHTPPQAFRDYLLEARPGPDVWEQGLAAMAEYSGQYTRPPSVMAGLEALLGKTPVEAITAYFETVYGDAGQDDTLVWKETFGEEFLPAFLEAGLNCVVILRDPRDSLTSQLAGSGEQFAGLPRPLLFLCRQWRKSALYALGLRDRPGMAVIRYEDVLRQRSDVLNARLPADLSLSFDQPIAIGRLPRNSSFDSAEQLSTAPIGRYRDWLEPADCRVIEALCFDEMRALGYEPEIGDCDRAGLIAAWIDEPEPSRPELAHYEWSDRHCEDELDRLRRLEARDGFLPEAFIFEQAFSVLQSGERSP